MTGLEELQVHVRRLLAELDRVCAAAQIEYTLAYGTAIGAVRDGDLIPWDPDADVWMASADHARFRAACAELLGPEFGLLAPETHDDYEYLFPRLVLRGTHHVLLSLDVFPLDNAPASAWGRSVHRRLTRLLDRAFLVKRGDVSVRRHYSPTKRLVTRALRLFAAPVPAGLVLAAFRRLQTRRPSGVLVNSCGAYGAREFFDAAWFAGTRPTPLGPVPVGVEPLLTSLYGDYLRPPDPERRSRELEHALTTFVEPLRVPGGLLS